MFSLTTTMFYMLSAYMAFLIGSSSKLPMLLVLLVPIGFVAGYLLDRLNSVKKIWVEDQARIINLVTTKYFVFLFISGAFFAAGLLFTRL